MDSRNIYYIDEKEDALEREVEQALKRSLSDNMELYCMTIAANYAMMDIDITNHPMEKVIYYIEDESN